MHKVKPRQYVRILHIHIAVPANVKEGEIADEISALLENSIANLDSNILDWQYEPYWYDWRGRYASDDPQENEIFASDAMRMLLDEMRKQGDKDEQPD